MSSDQTRQAILNAAERLCADASFADVSLRDIVAEANVNLAAINYHFGSKDALLAEIYVTGSVALNKERFAALKVAEQAGEGRAEIGEILRAMIEPLLRGCLDPDRQRSAASRFMIRASTESIPTFRRIKTREVDHLRRFAAAMQRALPAHDETDIFWALHFALAMAHQTINDAERLTKLSDGICDLADVDGITERIVATAVAGMGGGVRREKPRTVRKG